MEHTISNNTDDQLREQTEQDAPDYPYEGEDAFDGMDVPDDAIDVPDGHLVHPFRADVDTGPPDVSEPPSKHARVEEEIEDLPKWPASERFTEQYPGSTAKSSSQWKPQNLEAAITNGRRSVMKMNGNLRNFQCKTLGKRR